MVAQQQSTSLTIYQNIDDPVATMRDMGEVIAKSQIFGCQSVEQGQVLALECITRNLPPFALAERYDIIQGKLSMKADAMLAGFEESGGEYEIAEYSPDACEIIFSRKKSNITIRITWDDAQAEPWPWKDKEKGILKTNWSTPIGRQDMLFARVVSRAVRRLAPGVVCGRYTPEEIQDFGQVDGGAVVHVPTTSGNNGNANGATTPDRKAPAEEIIDAEYEIKSDEKPADKPADESKPAKPKRTINATAGKSDDRTVVYNSEPCGEAMVEKIKDAIVRATQQGVQGLADRIKAKLKEAGIGQLINLSKSEADLLLSAIHKKEMEAFFDASLQGNAAFREWSESEAVNDDIPS